MIIVERGQGFPDEESGELINAFNHAPTPNWFIAKEIITSVSDSEVSADITTNARNEPLVRLRYASGLLSFCVSTHEEKRFVSFDLTTKEGRHTIQGRVSPEQFDGILPVLIREIL